MRALRTKCATPLTLGRFKYRRISVAALKYPPIQPPLIYHLSIPKTTYNPSFYPPPPSIPFLFSTLLTLTLSLLSTLYLPLTLTTATNFNHQHYTAIKQNFTLHPFYFHFSNKHFWPLNINYYSINPTYLSSIPSSLLQL